MSDLANRTGLARGTLYKALSDDGHPSIDTLMAVTRALGVRLTVAAGEPALAA